MSEPKQQMITRLEREARDEVARIARFKGVSGAQVLRWAVDAYIEQHSMELSNLYRPSTGQALEFSNSAKEIEEGRELARQWGEQYDRRGR